MSEQESTSVPYPAIPVVSHGNTPAAWTAVLIVLVGFLVGGVALTVSSVPMFVVGVIAVVVGPIIGMVMGALTRSSG